MSTRNLLSVSFRLVLIALTCVVLPTTARAQARTPRTPGQAWLALDLTVKIFYVKGYIDGVIAGRGNVVNIYRYPEFRRDFFLPRTKIPFDSMAILVTEHLTKFQPSQWEPLSKLVDQLYSDPANTCIPAGPALEAAMQRFRGEADKSIEERLAGLRRAYADACGS